MKHLSFVVRILVALLFVMVGTFVFTSAMDSNVHSLVEYVYVLTFAELTCTMCVYMGARIAVNAVRNPILYMHRVTPVTVATEEGRSLIVSDYTRFERMDV